MKYHISVKFIAILLATVLLAVAVSSGIGITAMVGMGLYENTVDDLYESQLTGECHGLAVELAHRYASLKMGNVPVAYWESYRTHYWTDEFREGYYWYTIQDYQGNVLESTIANDLTGIRSYEIVITDLVYRQVMDNRALSDSYFDFETQEPTMIPAEGTDSGEAISSASDISAYRDIYYDYETEQTMEITYTQAKLGKCIVTVYVTDGVLEVEPYWDILRIVYSYRYDLFWVLAASLLLFAVFAVYLCCAAGRKPGKDAVKAAGLNALPLDLYLAVCVLAEVGLIVLGIEAVEHLLWNAMGVEIALIAVLFVVAACLVLIAFCFACAAQFKSGKGYWWKNCLISRILRPIWRGIRGIFRGCGKFLGMLPVVWQFVVTLLAMGFMLFITYLLAFGTSYYRVNYYFVLILLAELGLCLGIFCYGVYAFGVLKKGAAIMARGDLRQLVPTKYLIGPFRTFAWELNRLSGAARRAAEQQLKSERMKTELITNVSHDIKTPLTSIINYVDLLEKPHTQEEGQEYLAVLSRQSQRLKKLVDDLMDMSKASSGNIAVEIQTLDAAEAVQQALGEFSDKLEKAGLIPVLQTPEKPMQVLADGKLVWRVLSNLLGNVVKYALPGTRVYADVTEAEGKVLLSIKNISREALNVSADELTERFVRGDASRNTEGSGLGLNIAKSLMELQHGSLDITVDGDLFKVTLSFPAAR